MEQEIKYYTGSDGIKKNITTIETTHLTNSLAKKYREMFESTTKDDFNNSLLLINDIKEELHSRLNKFYDNLGGN